MAEKDQRVTSRFLMERYNVCDRTIDRWTSDRRLNFPQPLRINGRRYWRLADVVAWEAQRAAAEASA